MVRKIKEVLTKGTGRLSSNLQPLQDGETKTLRRGGRKDTGEGRPQMGWADGRGYEGDWDPRRVQGQVYEGYLGVNSLGAGCHCRSTPNRRLNQGSD